MGRQCSGKAAQKRKKSRLCILKNVKNKLKAAVYSFRDHSISSAFKYLCVEVYII